MLTSNSGHRDYLDCDLPSLEPKIIQLVNLRWTPEEEVRTWLHHPCSEVGY
jgi:hypothetical protein